MPCARGPADMSDPRELLIDWLRDAHAMERHSGHLLQAQAKRLAQYRTLALRLEQHLKETRRQQRALEDCLERLGSSASATKDLAGSISAAAHTLVTMAAADETVKSAIAGYVFAQFEVAAYTSLFAAAHRAGDIQAQHACERLLHQEEAMAQWLLGTLSGLTRAFLVRDAAADRGSTVDPAPAPRSPPGR